MPRKRKLKERTCAACLETKTTDIFGRNINVCLDCTNKGKYFCSKCNQVLGPEHFRFNKSGKRNHTWCNKCFLHWQQKGKDKKICLACNEQKTLDDFRKKPGIRGKLQYLCNECEAQNKAYCCECKQILDLNSFYINKGRPCSWCKNCSKKWKEKVGNKKIKECTQCKEIKSFDQFSRGKSYPYETSDVCLQCKESGLKKNDLNHKRNLRRLQGANRRKDPSYRFYQNLSRAIRCGFNRTQNKKPGPTQSLLPYTIKELQAYLEAQFEPWMNWNNQGHYSPKAWDDNDSSTWRWQLDHIIPMADLPFGSVDDENFKICWGLANLRPLSAKQNLLDGTRRTRHTKPKKKRSTKAA